MAERSEFAVRNDSENEEVRGVSFEIKVGTEAVVAVSTGPGYDTYVRGPVKKMYKVTHEGETLGYEYVVGEYPGFIPVALVE